MANSIDKITSTLDKLTTTVGGMFDEKDGLKTNITVTLPPSVYVNLAATIVVSFGILILLNVLVGQLKK